MSLPRIKLIKITTSWILIFESALISPSTTSNISRLVQSPDDNKADPLASETIVSSTQILVVPESELSNSNTVKRPSPGGIVEPEKENPITIPNSEVETSKPAASHKIMF